MSHIITKDPITVRGCLITFQYTVKWNKDMDQWSVFKEEKYQYPDKPPITLRYHSWFPKSSFSSDFRSDLNEGNYLLAKKLKKAFLAVVEKPGVKWTPKWKVYTKE